MFSRVKLAIGVAVIHKISLIINFINLNTLSAVCCKMFLSNECAVWYVKAPSEIKTKFSIIVRCMDCFVTMEGEHKVRPYGRCLTSP